MRAGLFALVSLTLFACATATPPHAQQDWQQQPCTVRKASVWLKTSETLLLGDVRVGGGPHHALQIDTGSTGIAIGHMHIGRSTPLSAAEIARFGLRPNFIGYDSSGNVPVGTWVWTSVELPGGVTIPRVPVLAVGRKCQAALPSIEPDAACASQPPLSGPCPQDRGGPVELTEVCEMGMMGVGFDRGASMGTWQVNPFLNAQPMLDGVMQRGYVVTREGVRLGMSEQDVAGFRFLPLTRIAEPYEWQQATGCVSIAGGGVVDPGKPVCGNTLMDTGVDEMFISYAAASMPKFDPPLPATGDLWNCKSRCSGREPATTVVVSWPDASAPSFTYSVTTPAEFHPTGPIPSRLHVRGVPTLADPAEQMLVNTSRQLLQTADYLYDATCGRIGFRPRPPEQLATMQ